MTGAGYSYQPTGLTFGALAVSGGSALSQIPEFGTNSASRSFTSALPLNGYGSYLIQAPSALINGALTLSHTNDTPFSDSNFGVLAPTRNSGGGAAFVGPSSASAGADLNTNQTYLQVFKYVDQGSGLHGEFAVTEWLMSLDQFIHFKAGGLTEAELNAAPVGTGATEVWSRAGVQGSYNSFTELSKVNLFLQAFNDISRELTHDELRFSDASIDEVTPLVPEPSGGLLLLGIALAVRRAGCRR